MTLDEYKAFNYRNASASDIDAMAEDLRDELKQAKLMFYWPHNDRVQAGYPPHLVQDHCVNNPEWQKIRLSMKGRPTHEKLRILLDWWEHRMANAYQLATGMERSALATETAIQVGNYLGALRRGGQLDAQNQVRRYI